MDRNGISLASAYIAATEKEASDKVASHHCRACGKSDSYIAGDKGKKKHLGDICYYKVGMRCQCGFINFVFLIINDIERKRDKSIISAEEALAKALQDNLISNSDLEACLVDTKALAFRGELEKAIRLAEQCALRFKDSAPAQYNFGCLLGKLKNYELAVEFLSKALDIDREFNAAWYQLGIINQEIGNYAYALECFDHFLDKHPKHADAVNRKKKCETELTMLA